MPWLLVAGCGGSLHPTSVADQERLADHYETTARAIEAECLKSRRNELTVPTTLPCWKAQDVRFLEANRDAAAKHRAAASQLREDAAPVSASR